MSKTYGRIAGGCWEEVYQKAQEISVLQRHQENNYFALARVRQYLIVIAYRTRMDLKSISKRLDPTASLATFVSLGLGIAAFIDFKAFISIIISNWILILCSMVVGIFLVRPVCLILLPLLRAESKKFFGNQELELKHQNLESDFLALRKQFLESQIGSGELGDIPKSLVKKANQNSDAATRDFALSRVKKIRQYLHDGEYLFDYGNINEVTKDRETLQGLALLDKSILMKRVEKSDDFLDVAYYAFFDNPSDIERIANDLESMANSLSNN